MFKLIILGLLTAVIGIPFLYGQNQKASNQNVYGTFKGPLTSTASSPAFQFNGDTGVGFYRSATDELRFATSGSDVMTLKSDGRVGVGVTAPRAGYKLDLYEASNNGLNIQSGDAGTDNIASFGSASAADKVLIKASGDVVVSGTLSASQLSAPILRGYTGVPTGGPSTIAVAYGAAGYLVHCSGNYSGGASVRSRIDHIVLDNDGAAIAFQYTISNLNAYSYTFTVSGGNLCITGVAHNTHCSVMIN